MHQHQPQSPAPPSPARSLAEQYRTGRVWLDVPYSDKDTAKQLGARWDAVEKRWYDPRPPTAGLERWAALPEVPELLPGRTGNSARACSWTWSRPAAGSPTSAVA